MVTLLAPILEMLSAAVALAIALLARNIVAPIVNLVSRELGWFSKGVEWLTNKFLDGAIALTHNIAPAFEAGVKPLVGYLHALGQLSEYTAHAIYRNALQLNQFAHWVTQTYIPRELRAIIPHSTLVTLTKIRTVPLSRLQLRTIERDIEAHFRKAIGAAIPGVVPKAWPKVNWTPKHWRQWLGLGALGGALALPGTLAWEKLFGHRVNKDLTSIGKRLRRLEKLLGATGAAALVVAGLAKLGLGWMSRCRNLKHIGPAFCGADLSALIGLFGALAVIEGGFSIVTLAEEMLAVETQMVKLIGGAFSELDGLV